ncbi:type VI secretion system-associated protein TagF [Roseibium suaedae]|uniref:Type VI secretion-associated protein, BMA_A0400 family n=1 Tax=Roseibium suaedae TaxID=735517 RepID=A0A1M7P8T0_9HYPH|nr:type VI secretion system-associated protein TagF [Roseibium suaedae]SHN13142.1 type VI secretion-associated protein, BMA_A0400 family [Roseibium suaedae]
MEDGGILKAAWQAGWYGKVPCTGDFIRSGLSAGLIRNLDQWLQELLTAGRQALGDQWQAAYMTAPIWRFVTPAGVFGPAPCAGVIMPSVDRVGRQFPLCLALESQETGEVPMSAVDAYNLLEPVFPALEDAALAMLDDDATLSLLEEAVTQVTKQMQQAPSDALPLDQLQEMLAPGSSCEVLKVSSAGPAQLILLPEDHPPLSATLTSPPQGGRRAGTGGSGTSSTLAAAPFSPLAGEMPPKGAEGGNPIETGSQSSLPDPLTTSLWISAYQGTERLILVPGLPEGADLASAFFDLEAPCWQPAAPDLSTPTQDPESSG